MKIDSSRPTQIGFWLISLYDVSPSDSKFGANFRLVYKFSHSDLDSIQSIFETRERHYYDEKDVTDFMPGQALEIQNALELEVIKPTVGEKNIGLLFSDSECDKEELKLEVTYRGVFKHTFRMEKFPYDQQNLNIRCVFWAQTDYDYDRIYEHQEIDKPAFNADMVEQSDYEFMHTKSSFSDHHPCAGNIEIAICRKPGFYNIGATLPLLFILLTSLSSYFIDVTDIASRFSVSITLLLTVVAVKFVISNDIPKAPYFTIADMELLSIFLFLSFVTFSHVQIDSVKDNEFYRSIALLFCVCIFLFMLFQHIRFNSRRQELANNVSSGISSV